MRLFGKIQLQNVLHKDVVVGRRSDYVDRRKAGRCSRP